MKNFITFHTLPYDGELFLVGQPDKEDPVKVNLYKNPDMSPWASSRYADATGLAKTLNEKTAIRDQPYFEDWKVYVLTLKEVQPEEVSSE